MIHGTAALSKIQHGSQSSGKIALRPLHSLLQTEALRQVGRNGAGQGTAGSMRVGIIDPFTIKPANFSIPVQQIIGIVMLMAALHQHGTAAGFSNQGRRTLHILRCLYLHSGKNLCLRNIRRQHVRHGKQSFFQNLHRILADQARTAGRNHHRIHHDIFRPVFLKLIRNRFDQPRRGYHADLHRIRTDVRKYTVKLFL